MERLIENLINQCSLSNLRKFFEEKLRIQLKEFEDILPKEDYEEYFGKLYVLKPYGEENIRLKDDIIAIYAIESKKELSERSSKKGSLSLQKGFWTLKTVAFLSFMIKRAILGSLLFIRFMKVQSTSLATTRDIPTLSKRESLTGPLKKPYWNYSLIA